MNHRPDAIGGSNEPLEFAIAQVRANCDWGYGRAEWSATGPRVGKDVRKNSQNTRSDDDNAALRSNVRLGNKSAQVAQNQSSNTSGCRVRMVGELRTYTKSRGRTAYVHAGSGITY